MDARKPVGCLRWISNFFASFQRQPAKLVEAANRHVLSETSDSKLSATNAPNFPRLTRATEAQLAHRSKSCLTSNDASWQVSSNAGQLSAILRNIPEAVSGWRKPQLVAEVLRFQRDLQLDLTAIDTSIDVPAGPVQGPSDEPHHVRARLRKASRLGPQCQPSLQSFSQSMRYRSTQLAELDKQQVDQLCGTDRHCSDRHLPCQPSRQDISAIEQVIQYAATRLSCG